MSRKAKNLQASVGVMSPSSPTDAASEGYRIIETDVFGTVQWFNYKEGYGFIQRADTKEDIFLHHTAIGSTRVQKYLSSVGDGKVVKFDVVEGRKGPQAVNVTITVQNNVTTKKDLSEVRLQEQLKLKEKGAHLCSLDVTTKKDLSEVRLQEQLKEKKGAHLHNELETLKNDCRKQLKNMKKEHSIDLQAMEATYRSQLQAQEAQSRKEEEEQKATFNKKLEAQEARFNKEKASKKGDPWFYVFGGVCVVIGFLSAKCLTK